MKLRLCALSALTLLAACANQGAQPSDHEPAADFRDGSYFYVLGYSGPDGEQIRGGAHAVVGFDANGKTEAIDSANRVSRLHPDVTTDSEYHVYDAALTSGETDWDVFASTWWPQSDNGTAWRWQPGANQDYNDRSDVDRLSPMEKYDLMFYPGQEQVVPAVSHCTYADYVDDPDNCEQIEHPEVTVAGPATAWELENQGVYQWVEPESWWGHCNGWASYATTEPLGYPARDITVRMDEGRVVECEDGEEGCIEWRMADIEALMTELYFSDQATFSGRRCNTRPDEIERDEFGRPTEVACRDLNPGSFHVAITGMLGRGARNLATDNPEARPAFIIDHNWDYQVWNFPIVSYTIDDQEELSVERANELVGATGSDYHFNDDAQRFVRVAMTYSMISDGVPVGELLRRADQRDVDPHNVELNYILELDANDRILGGEWIEDPTVTWGSNSKELHPDFIWMAVDAVGWGENADDTGGDNDNPFVSYNHARALLQCANEPASCAAEPGGGSDDVFLNTTDLVAQDASQTHELELEPGVYTFTLAHHPTNPGGDADLYVRVGSEPTMQEYDCRPYLNGSDEECEVRLDEAATVFAMVHGYGAENHYRLTVTGQGNDGGGDGGGDTWAGMEEGGTVARQEELRFATGVVPAGSYDFAMTGTADADLYVRVGSEPTTSTFDCRPYSATSNETCSVSLAEAGEIHVMVRGYAASSTFELVGARN